MSDEDQLPCLFVGSRRLVNLAFEIADEAAQSAIECNLLEVRRTPADYAFLYEGSASEFKATMARRVGSWWDILSLDPNAKESIERDIHYLELRGKLTRHPDLPHLVRVSA